MPPASTVSQTSVRLRGKAVLGATGRHSGIPGFDQVKFSRSSVLCVGAGGLISHIAPTLVRKGIGRITVLDNDVVEANNLNRQRFFEKDLGQAKALALAANLQAECIVETDVSGVAFRLEEAIARGLDLTADVAICGVDNNPARMTASRHFRGRGIPVIFAAVSADADHGYVFVQEREGACIACLFPDMANDDCYPCPGTPATADILQLIGALAVYAFDALLMDRPKEWNYRRISLSDGAQDGATMIGTRQRCANLSSHLYCRGAES